MRKLNVTLVVFITLFAFISCGRGNKQQTVVEEKPVSVTIAQAATRNISITRVYSGSLEGLKQARIYASIPVAVVDLPVSQGSEVSAGQPVIILDRQGVASQYQQAEAMYQQAKDNYDKMGKLYNEGAISEQTFNNIKTAYEVAKANFDAARQQVELTSPISGILTDLNVNVGEFVSMGVPLATIAQTDKMRLTIYVDSRGSIFIKPGQKAQVSIDTDGNGQSEFEGTVTEVSRSADPDTRLFKVEIQIDNANKNLRPGMFARAAITIAELQNVLTVPRESVFITEGVAKVFKVNSDRAQEQTVTLGESSNEYYQITGGLNPDDSIIVLGRNQVENGSLIKVVNQTDTLSAQEGSKES